jgi:phage tail sheath protein FI
MLIVIEPAIRDSLDSFVFELNDESTRLMVRSMITSYMTSIKARGGVQDFKVVCDTANNSDSDIDNYKMNVDVYVKPTLAIEFIKTTVIITRQGTDFNVLINN